jgi:hypothetical protein
MPACSSARTSTSPANVVFAYACKLGCEGIVSKRLGSRLSAGPGQVRGLGQGQNPAAPAIRREAEEDWGSGGDAHVQAIQTETTMASKAEEYRAKARECETLAEQTGDSFIKEQLLAVAKAWRNMAAYEDKRPR